MVAPLVLAAGISAASSLAGQLLSGKPNHTGRDQRQAIAYANRSAVLDKVAAAKEAGISPLYALGAPVISGGGVSVGGDSGLGSTISSMGADISRAVAAGQTSEERALQALTLEKAALENDYLKAQIGSLRTRTAKEALPPPFPGAMPEQVSPAQHTPGVNIWGYPFESAPDTSDAQAFQNRLGEGELAETIASLIVGGADLWHNSQLRRAINTPGSGSPSAARQIFDYLYGR